MMKLRPTSLVCAAIVGGAALSWSSDSRACAYEPYISAVCIMAIPWTNLNGYTPANGALLSISSNQALFSLIGTTYGGDGVTTFQLPDLRGRMAIGAGAGPGLPVYTVGNMSGTATVTLLPANVPLVPHSHAITTGAGGVVVTAGIGSLAANTTLTGLSATTSLTGVTATAAGSGLTLNGSNGGNFGTSPSGTSLGSYASTTKIYSDAAPTVAMKSGAISGNATVTFSGSPTTTISGTPTTTLSGAPTVSLSGMTGAAGASASVPVSIMPPYIALNYFVAVQGIYPSRN